jgi:hypothetical protein
MTHDHQPLCSEHFDAIRLTYDFRPQAKSEVNPTAVTNILGAEKPCLCNIYGLSLENHILSFILRHCKQLPNWFMADTGCFILLSINNACYLFHPVAGKPK